MPDAVFEMTLTLPRHAFTPREVARAADLWRAFQDVAVEASTAAGWPPQRYREVGTSFVVRSMRVVHHREVKYGERLTAQTWVSSFRGRIFSNRQLRLFDDAGPVASATQEWAHVSKDLRPKRADAALFEAFPIHDDGSLVEVPKASSKEGPRFECELECWHTWMDPLAHINHPVYVDFCDEALARRVFELGVDPVHLRAHAEEVTFRSGVTALERVKIESTLASDADQGALHTHHIQVGDRTAAQAVTIRSLQGGNLEQLIRGPRSA